MPACGAAKGEEGPPPVRENPFFTRNEPWRLFERAVTVLARWAPRQETVASGASCGRGDDEAFITVKSVDRREALLSGHHQAAAGGRLV
jgi:hypothetical protein